jgi:Lysophospholipase L1 and related esterases
VRNSIDKSIEFVDIYDVLNSKKNEYIFYKTDHHWTTKTAFRAYEKLGADMGFIPHEENYFNIKKVTDSFYGSLYSKGGFRNINPDSIELYIPKKNEVNKVEYVDEHKFSDSIYNMEDLNKKDKYAVFFDGNHGLIKISTNVSNGKKLLVVKDSYANCLIPFLTGHYSEIYVVDPRYYSDDLKELIKINSIKNMLILYNVNTFFEEESIENISTTETNKNSNTLTGTTSQASTNTSTDRAAPNTALNYKEFFKGDVFMGDSITDGISYCEFLDDVNVCAKVGINISNTKNEVNRIAIQNPRNIYLLYGVNDMDDTMPSQWFVEQYRELLHRVKAKFPNSNIYVQSILPVAPEVEQKTPHINNKHINETNEGLINMAKQENVNYLNIASVLNENNRDLYEPDGTHFKAPFYTLWLNYVANNIK